MMDDDPDQLRDRATLLWALAIVAMEERHGEYRSKLRNSRVRFRSKRADIAE
jgi:hypothetical protein